MFVEELEGLWTLIIIPPFDGACRGKRKKKNTFLSCYVSVAASLSLNQPAYLFILFNKNFGVSILSGLGHSCHSSKMQKENSNSEVTL